MKPIVMFKDKSYTKKGAGMKKINNGSWPVLIISDQLGKKNDSGYWLEKIIYKLKNIHSCTVLFSSSVDDALDIVMSRHDLGTIIIEKEFEKLQLSKKHDELLGRYKVSTDNNNAEIGFEILIDMIRKQNQRVPILLLTSRSTVEDITEKVFSMINGTIWMFTDTPDFLAGNIVRQMNEYADGVLPPFFTELVRYVNEYKYAWHTPGHMGGQGFLRSPAGTAFHKFFGEEVLRADLSVSVPELGSLLDHSGVTGEAEEFSSKVFGSDLTFYVLNGTSTANQIIWRSVVLPDEKTLVDRNCHKSLNYAMVITSAKPNYMIPLRNKMGIIGPVDFTKIPKLAQGRKYKMSALTNSTYDGVCYEVGNGKGHITEYLKCAENWHFDEAWYAYAKFNEFYREHFAMELPPLSKGVVFATHSTHKLLTAFSQASMLHIKLPSETGSEKDKNQKREFYKATFNESYMMHGSTSPQYNMIASLEVATKMMYDNGNITFNEIIAESIELRRKIVTIKKSEEAKTENNWFFGLWQPPEIGTESSMEDLMKPEMWKIKPDKKKTAWHGFDFDAKVLKAYTMLDPIKLTITCPGFDVENGLQKNRQGIPAAIVTKYLIGQGIVCEKSDYYSFLLLNSIGTTKGKQGTLIAELLKFKQFYDNGTKLVEVFPEFVRQYPCYEKNENGTYKTLKDHCTEMHKEIAEKELLTYMNNAFEVIPEQVKTPAEAYKDVVQKKVGYMTIEDIKKSDREDILAGVMLVPYPPGIPIMMGGESFRRVYKNYSEKETKPETVNNCSILDYLKARQDFENKFPGYESDIHGIERTEPDSEGRRFFKTLVTYSR